MEEVSGPEDGHDRMQYACRYGRLLALQMLILRTGQ